MPSSRHIATDTPLSFRSVLEQSTNKLWGGHFPVPAAIAAELIEGGSRRVFCSINGRPEHQCALIPHGGGSFVITVNKGLREELGISPGSELRVTLRRDDSDYGLPMPEEFSELLRQDDDGNHFFHALTAGKQRTLLYIIGRGKTPDERISRALIVTAHLKTYKGRIDYKALNAALQQGGRTTRKRG
jgi:hypothetical protein